MAGGKLYNALQRQNNMAGFWQNAYQWGVGNLLDKFRKKTEKKKTPGENLDVPDNKGTEVQPDFKPSDSSDEKLYDPSVTDQTGAAGFPSGTDNGPGFIPRIYQQKTPKVNPPTAPGSVKYDPSKLVAGHTPNENNERIDAELQKFIADASRFGQVGMNYIPLAMNIASLNYEKPLPEGSIINKNGVATRMVFDPSNGSTQFVAIKDDKGKDLKYFDLFPEKETEQKIKEKSLKPTLSPVRIPSTDGVSPDKLGFMNMDDFSVKATDVGWEDYNTNPLNYDKLAQDMEKLMIKEQSNNSGSKSSGKKNDSGVSNNPGTPLLMYNGKVVTYENASDFGIPKDVVKNYYSGNAKLKQKAMNQLAPYSGKITYQQPTGTPPVDEYNTPEKWKGLWDLQYKRAQDPTSPYYKQAVDWFNDPKNVEAGKNLGLKIK